MGLLERGGGGGLLERGGVNRERGVIFQKNEVLITGGFTREWGLLERGDN